MDCSQVKQRIPEWLDGELEVPEANLVSAHIESCTDCRAEVAFWQKLGTTLREDLGDIKAPPGFTSGVMAQLIGTQQTGFERFISRWKRSLAVAATFLLVAAGSIGAYIQMGNNIAGHVAANGDDTRPGHMSPKEPDTVYSAGETDVLPIEPQDQGSSKGSDNPSTTSEQNDNAAKPNGADQETEVTGNNPPSTEQTGNNAPAKKDLSGQYTLLNTENNRVIERTLLRVKVEDMNTARNQALSLVNNTGAQYEVLGSEITPDGGQESLKVVVNNNLSSKLQGDLKTLGQVITTDTQRDDLNSRYNEKVEQYRTLEAQAHAAKTSEERNQLQVKMAGIEAQLRAWDREANTATVILWLEN